MAFDYGSIDLGLRNPFKKEGAVTAIRGLVATAIGAFLLISAASIVREDIGTGWVLIVFGVLMLGMGIRVTAAGIYATLKYFVERIPGAEGFSGSASP